MDYEVLKKATDHIRALFPDAHPRVGLVCGSGWSEVADIFQCGKSFGYENIPGLGRPGVQGHAGSLGVGQLHGVETLIFQGRRHYYEGEGWTPIALPLYALKQLGAEIIVLTNAAGCLKDGAHPGHLMAIQDHINAMGVNPLIGPHRPEWGERFPDQSHVYHPDLVNLLLEAGQQAGASIFPGVYLATSGPTYETPAEIRAFQRWGADAVGMSTVPEATLANAAGMKVVALSCMTNYAAGISPHPLTHGEVTETTRATMPVMRKTLEGFWEKLAGWKVPTE